MRRSGSRCLTSRILPPGARGQAADCFGADQARRKMRTADLARVRLVLMRSAHFGTLAPAALERLAQMAALRQARSGERIDRKDSADECLWIVVDGAVRLSARPVETGAEQVYAVIAPGSYFGLATAAHKGPF